MREQFNWLATFTMFVAGGSVYGVHTTNNRMFVAPLIPLTFILGYQADMIWGNKAENIRSELILLYASFNQKCCAEIAENELRENGDKFALPLGMITFEDVEKRRLTAADEARLRPNEAFL